MDRNGEGAVKTVAKGSAERLVWVPMTGASKPGWAERRRRGTGRQAGATSLLGLSSEDGRAWLPGEGLLHTPYRMAG